MFQEGATKVGASNTVRESDWKELDEHHDCSLYVPYDDLFRYRSYWLRQTALCVTNPLTTTYFSSIYSTEKGIIYHISGPHWYIIHPLSKFVIVWEQIMMIVHIINWYVVLFQISNYAYLTSVSETINFIIQGPCYADIVLRFFIGYTTAYEVCLAHHLIIKHYLKSTFFVDLLTSIPFQVVQRLLVKRVNKLTLNIVILYQALKVLTFNRIRIYFQNAMAYWGSSFMLYSVLSLTLYSVLFFYFTVFFFHTSANILELISPNNTNPLNNVTRFDQYPTLGPFWCRNLYCIYVVALEFYCFTFAYGTLDAHDTLLEIGMLSVVIIGAYIYHLYLLVKVITIFQFRNAAKIKYQEIMNQLEEYMRTKRLPLTIKRSLIHFYQHRYQYRFFKEKTILENLSEPLRRELVFHWGQLFIKRIGVFDNISTTLLSNIVTCLKPEIYMPNDLITKAGTVGDCMYFIASGTVSIRATTGQELQHLEDGDHFGETSLFSKHGTRVSNTIAIEYCELYRLDKSDYEANIAIIPELADKFEALAVQRMNATTYLSESSRVAESDEIKSKSSSGEEDDGSRESLSNEPPT